MNRWMLALPAALVLAMLMQAPPSMAQMDPMHLASVSMANQLGATEYCVKKGWAHQTAVDAQKKIAASLPAIPDQTGLAEAEAMGRKGLLMNNSIVSTLSSMARREHRTESDLCTRMASAARTAAARQSSPSAKPAIQGGSVPTLSPGSTMPETIPAMPETTKPQ